MQRAHLKSTLISVKTSLRQLIFQVLQAMEEVFLQELLGLLELCRQLIVWQEVPKILFEIYSHLYGG